MTFGYCALYAPIQSKLQHPPSPGQGKDIGSFEDWIVQIPSLSGQNGVQMPDPIVGFVCKEQSLSAPVVCKKACEHLRYAETSLQDGKLFKMLAMQHTIRGNSLSSSRNRTAGTLRTAE